MDGKSSQFGYKTFIGAILRQKHYHILKMSYEHFTAVDLVYVFHPKKNWLLTKSDLILANTISGRSKVSEVLYKVNYGRNGKEQVVHCDRMTACKAQVLRGDGTEQCPSDSINPLVDLEEQDDDFGSSYKNVEVTEELIAVGRPKRERRTQTWLQDYIQD